MLIDAGTPARSAFARRFDVCVIGEWLRADDPAMPLPETNMGAGGSYHHMCTTRMSDDPVVDSDCRVHGLGNLYIGGPSTFATSGYVKPPYTIVQMARRLSLTQELQLRPMQRRPRA